MPIMRQSYAQWHAQFVATWAEQRQRIPWSYQLYEQLPSTQAALIDWVSATPNDSVSHRLIASQQQSAGYGRNGRLWHSPADTGATLSLAWQYPNTLAWQCLPLLVGMALVDLANTLSGKKRYALKWPNDVVANLPDGRLAKLAGIIAYHASHKRCLIVGIGMNVTGAPAGAINADYPVTWLNEGNHIHYSSAEIAARIGHQVGHRLSECSPETMRDLASAWHAYDALANRAVVVKASALSEPVYGIAQGIDADGALHVVNASGDSTCFYTVESLRLANNKCAQ